MVNNMTEIIRGTTPTIKYTFKKVDTADLTTAYLTVRQGNDIMIERDISTAEIAEGYVSWVLTQEETLSLARGAVIFMLNWKTADGTRGASEKRRINVVENDKNEVI